MSEAASVPLSETKAPESADRLNKEALRLGDISASTMANIGLADSFHFGAAVLCGAAYIIASSSVLGICGGHIPMVLQYHFNWNVPLVIISVLFTAGAMYMM